MSNSNIKLFNHWSSDQHYFPDFPAYPVDPEDPCDPDLPDWTFDL